MKLTNKKTIINDNVTYKFNHIEMLNYGYSFVTHERFILNGLSIEEILYQDNIIIDLEAGL